MKSSSSFSTSSSSSKKEIRSRTRTRTTTRRILASGTLAAILLAAFGATAQTTNTLSDAEIQGRQLVQKLLAQQPTEDFTNTGVLNIRSKGITTNLPVKFAIIVTQTNWQAIYTASFLSVDTSNESSWEGEVVKIVHASAWQNQYEKTLAGSHFAKQAGQITVDIGPNYAGSEVLSAERAMIPFANSDFWLADLGLEFFHWPGQKILKKEFARRRGCMVLESTNPNPSTNGYSRVVSWIDEESGGIVQAQAYDFNNKLLKEFAPKSFKKNVNGQWELQEMEIYNDQTRSRTQIKFDLKAK
jgi:hypothetical protein